MSVTLSMHCHEGDREKLYSNFGTIMHSHKFAFSNLRIVHQRTKPGKRFKGTCTEAIEIEAQDYDDLLRAYDIPIDDPRADELTHGKSSSHYWKNHCVNHLAGLKHCTTKYIVFSDSDCIMVRNEPCSWIEEGIRILERDPTVFAISPSDGASGRQWIMSQQLFLVETARFRQMDFNCWDGKFIDGGPMQEFYCMMEGRISMFMLKHGLCRIVLPDNWRYHHDWVHHPETYGYDLPKGLA